MMSGDIDSNSYDVGYKKPPKHTQFQKGNRANPNGRPKRDNNLIVSLSKFLEEDIGLSGRPMTRKEATIRVVVQDAMRGDQKAFARYLKLATRAGLLKIPPKPRIPYVIPRMTEQQKEDYLRKQVLRDIEADERAKHAAEAETKR